MENKKKALKKFRRKNIVIPIIVFFLAILLVIFLGITIIGAEVLFTLSSKIDGEKKIADYVAYGLQKEMEESACDIQTVLDDCSESVVVLKDGQVVLSNCGEIAIDIFEVKPSGASVYLNVDKKKETLVTDENALSMSGNNRMLYSPDGMSRVIRKFLLGKNKDDAVAKLNVWIPTELTVDEGTVLVYRVVELKYRDMEYVIISIFAAVAIILFLMVILLCNIIRSFLNNNRMLNALYFDDKTLDNNWLYFTNKTEKQLRNRNYMYAVLAIKCCRYEHFCSCQGVEKGDELVLNMFRSIKKVLPPRACIARNSDASFGVFLRGKTQNEIADAVLAIRNGVSELVHIGVYMVPAGAEAAPENAPVSGNPNYSKIENYYHFAKITCDAITDANSSEILYFNETLREEHMWKSKVENLMEDALANEEFVVYIQPKYDPKTSELKGAEALIRWVSRTEGFISPGKFIPIFEENGFITKIDDYMVSHVAKLQSEWLAAGYRVVPISVNISRLHFIEPNLAEHILELVDNYQTPHEYIEIELTESAFFDDKSALLKTVDKLQNYGFHVSMDDFGSGYSSLNSLKDLPLNVLKLDAEFFRGEQADSRGEVIVGKAIELAKDLNMEIVAEGVEQKEQVDFLASAGCDMIQGFYFDKPMPVSEFETRMATK